MKLLVLDGNSILNRAFYGIKLLTTKNGQFTNAIYGFMNVLLKLEKSENPDEIAIAFDLKAPTFRHKMYDGYKAHRKGMPEELAAQMPVLKELLAALGYKMVSLEGYEADDILGTLAGVAAARGDECQLATGDRDSLQLVQNGVTVLLTTTKMGKGETTCLDEAAIMEKYGVKPRQLIETKALMGDSSDNIPGVPGVGEKTAFALIQQFGTVDAVYENIEDESIKTGVRKKLIEGKESAEMSYRLAEINCEVPIETATGTYARGQPDIGVATEMLSGLEMYTILDRIGLERVSMAPIAGAKPLPQVKEEPLPNGLVGMIFMAPATGGWMITPAGQNKVYFASEGAPELIDLIRNEKAFKRVFDAKELHRMALRNDKEKPCQSIVFDAKLAAYLLNPAGTEYSVARLAPEYGEVGAYACEDYPDAPLLEPLFRRLYAECEKAEMLKLLTEIEQPLAEVLASMEIVGVALNAQGVKTFGEELQTQLKKHLEDIHNMAGCEFNVNSPKQLAEVLFDKMGLPHGKKTKSGWSTDAETLEGLREHSPVIDSILLYRTYQKLNSTYVEGLLRVVGDDGRIHSTFNQTEARTGRISSNEPNMQNIPVRTELGSRIREFFVAPADCVFADADYSQIELRILADISGDAAMQEAFRAGEDIHRATAARVNGLPLAMVTPQLRSAAKAVNFGIVYGIGAFSLSKDLGISIKEADEFIKNYLNNFPGVKEYMDKTIEFGTKHGYVATQYGRRRPLPELASSNRNVQALGQRMAMNTPIQGTAADIIKIAMIRVFCRLRKEKLQAQLVLQVHDELIVETPLEEADKVKLLLQEEMQQAAKLAVPMEADVHLGKNWLEAKG